MGCYMAQVGSKYEDWECIESVGSAIYNNTKTPSTIASSTFQSWIIILYSRFHVEENGIFHLLKKILYFPFQNLLLFVENFNISENGIIIVGTVKELWYEQYEPLCSFMQVSFFFSMKFCTITKFKKDCSKINFSKREKSKIYIYNIYKNWKFSNHCSSK